VGERKCESAKKRENPSSVVCGHDTTREREKSARESKRVIKRERQ